MSVKLFTGLLAFLIIGFSSCKKDEDDTTVTKSYTVNTPPESGSYFVGLTTNQEYSKYYAAWTTDFDTYNKFTDEFDNVFAAFVDDGMIIIVENQDPTTALYFIHYAPVNDLKNFSKVSSIYRPEKVAMNNGTIVTYSSEFSRTGYCKTLMSESTVTWTSLPANHSIYNLKTINEEIMGVANVAGNASYVKITENGTVVTFNVPGYIASIYEFIEGKTWGLNSTSWGSITTNDWANGAWETDNMIAAIEGNTTTINGTFEGYRETMKILPGEWRIYGLIKEDTNQMITNHACVNKSTDNGVTWTTSLIPAIQEGDAYTIPVASSSITVLQYMEQSMSFPDFYSSTDGVNFTKWTDETRIFNIQNFGEPQHVR